MIIDLQPVYKCSSCKAIIDEKELVRINTDIINISRCPVCGCEFLVLLKLED